ncbi:MAG: hypothetical protein PUK24_06240 [Elusimicrobia bacterium]|nr:hypothetical protein [Elusimicrobiota bacterium]MDY6039780.1 hypothetical protein [Elusimicrobiaceae bacterium]
MAANLKNNKQVEALKKGFQDIQTVMQEGNYKLFVKQFVAVLVVFLGFKYCSGQFADKINNYNGQMDAIHMQQSSEREYMTNKDLLFELEPRFPDISDKNGWLTSQILGVFKDAELTPQMNGSQTEDASNPTYEAVSLQVSSEMDFTRFARFLADIENNDEYLKVSDFSITKDTDPEHLGNNKISMKFNTIFPKEKIAKQLFKDYDTIMAQKRAKPEAEKQAGGKL